MQAAQNSMHPLRLLCVGGAQPTGGGASALSTTFPPSSPLKVKIATAHSGGASGFGERVQGEDRPAHRAARAHKTETRIAGRELEVSAR